MPRIARKNLGTSFIHVMVQGVNKEYIFNNKEYIEKYLILINKYKEEHEFELLAYCIMNNHAHFLIFTEDINDFGKFMHRVNLLFAQKYNKEKNRSGVLFRNRYQTEPIYDLKYLINCIKYIHNNPVKAKMVEKCEDYQYSSYKDYINNDGVTKCKIMQEIFGKNCNYKELFNDAFERPYLDIEEETCKDKSEYILEGLKQFKEETAKETVDILSNRTLLKHFIHFLKYNCGIKYVEIGRFFNISKNVMDGLKLNN